MKNKAIVCYDVICFKGSYNAHKTSRSEEFFDVDSKIDIKDILCMFYERLYSNGITYSDILTIHITKIYIETITENVFYESNSSNKDMYY
mgnify:CR=1 FL=1|jgi:CRISPR/Cas system type I-B associated protein Csh2 (Cas7 group RAMP superfamily)